MSLKQLLGLWPWVVITLIVAACWTGDVLMNVNRRMPAGDDRIVGAAAISITFLGGMGALGLALWRAIIRRFPVLPGQRVITDEQQRQLESAITQAVLAGYRAEGEPPQTVRAVQLG